MPEEYEKIKKSYQDKGKSKEEAEAIAAATYNKYIAPKKKGDKRPVGNKAQQKAGSAVSEDNDEAFLDSIVEFLEESDKPSPLD